MTSIEIKNAIKEDGSCRILMDEYEGIKAEERKKVLDEVVEYINTMPTYSYGVSMLSAEEYIKKSDLIDMLEQIK